MLNPVLLATQGTIDGAVMAMDKGFAFNIGGGFHHSSKERSGGFCVYPDISLAINLLRKYFGVKKHMIIDLDAHQGDGHERDFINDPDVYIVDFYNPSVFPGDQYARGAIKCEGLITERTKDAEYIAMMKRKIVPAIEEFRPNFILYNAGSDISVGDPLGHLNVLVSYVRLAIIFWSKEIK